MKIDYYEGTSTLDLTTFQEWQTWNKPSSAKMHFCLVVGGGGAGGVPLFAAPNTSCFGGPGGSSGSQFTSIISTFHMPPVMYIQAGSGGKGSNNNSVAAQAANGSASVIALNPYGPAGGLLNFISAPGGSGGFRTGVAGQLLGQGYGILGGMGCGGTGSTYGSQVGLATNAAGNNVIVNTLTPTTGIMVTAGAGGGGMGLGGGANSVGGGSVLFNNQNDYWQNGIVGGAVNANGQNGLLTAHYMMNLGGGGGGATQGNTFGVAGSGGSGAPGCGGGGAGAAVTGATQGFGGNGGPGFVFIISF
jgi:hypothetical protein